MNSVMVKNVVFQDVKLHLGINGELNKSDKKNRYVGMVLLAEFLRGHKR